MVSDVASPYVCVEEVVMVFVLIVVFPVISNTATPVTGLPNPQGRATGVVKMQGCLTATASSNDADWFDIPLEEAWISSDYTSASPVAPAGTIEVSQSSILTHPSILRFNSNAKWIRIAYKYYPGLGVIGAWDKALLRN